MSPAVLATKSLLMIWLLDLTINVAQLKSSRLHILLISCNDDDENQTKVILCCNISFFNVLLLQHKANKIVEFPDSTGDK